MSELGRWIQAGRGPWPYRFRDSCWRQRVLGLLFGLMTISMSLGVGGMLMYAGISIIQGVFHVRSR